MPWTPITTPMEGHAVVVEIPKVAIVAPTNRVETEVLRRLRLPPGSLRVSNSSGTAHYLRGESFDRILLFGAGLLRPEIMETVRWHERRGTEVREYLNPV